MTDQEFRKLYEEEIGHPNDSLGLATVVLGVIVVALILGVGYFVGVHLWH